MTSSTKQPVSDSANPPVDPWVLEYDHYRPDRELHREALCTLGNGRFATRGAAPEHEAELGRHYPGTYIAGLYNRLVDTKAGRDIENESLVNLPNWLHLTFRIDGGDWFSIDDVEITRFRQALEMDKGMLVREVRFTDAEGRDVHLAQRRLVHMSRGYVAALETTIRSENWSGRVEFRSVIDGSVTNDNVDRYRDLSRRHLETVSHRVNQRGHVFLGTRTTQSHVEVVCGARHRLWVDGMRAHPSWALVEEDDVIGQTVGIDLDAGSETRVEKTVSVVTGKDDAISEPGTTADNELARAPDFVELEAESQVAWRSLWHRFEIDSAATPWVRQITNLHVFHLLQVTSPNTYDVDAAIPARGLHGEAYRGHIFWDELFVFPLLHVRSPEMAGSLLRYRHRRIPAARQAAMKTGYEGIMFPWQSGSDGREETQEVHLNPRSGRWTPDRSRRQRHINIAIAFNILQHHRFTGDVDFLAEFGAEMLIGIARFWTSIATYDRVTDRFDIVGVMGPDEFHDGDPNWSSPGLRNNAYTNVMVSWLLAELPKTLERLPGLQRESLEARLGLDQAELARWEEMSRKLRVPFHDDVIISQFEGYGDLAEFDWDGYVERYGNIERLDRILEAEGDSPNNYKASKQADLLMLFYLLSFEQLVTVFDRLGVAFDEEMLQRNIEYYLARTSHGSTLSRVVHSWVLARGDRARSFELFCEALRSDIDDIQGGTTKEGIHLGAMAGTVDLLQRGFSGMEAGGDGVLRFKPSLPPEIGKIHFSVYYHRRWIEVTVEGDDLRLTSEVTRRSAVDVECRDRRAPLASGETVVFRREEV